MSENVQRIIEGTFTAVFIYLILANWQGFSSAVNAIGGNSVKYVTALQGR